MWWGGNLHHKNSRNFYILHSIKTFDNKRKPRIPPGFLCEKEKDFYESKNCFFLFDQTLSPFRDFTKARLNHSLLLEK